jgi:IS1 family transposase
MKLPSLRAIFRAWQEAPSEPWPCNWDEHESNQLCRSANRSLRENLSRLENATESAQKFANSPVVEHPGFPKI